MNFEVVSEIFEDWRRGVKNNMCGCGCRHIPRVHTREHPSVREDNRNLPHSPCEDYFPITPLNTWVTRITGTHYRHWGETPHNSEPWTRGQEIALRLQESCRNRLVNTLTFKSIFTLQWVPVIKKTEIFRESLVSIEFLIILSRRLSFLPGELPQQPSSFSRWERGGGLSRCE